MAELSEAEADSPPAAAAPGGEARSPETQEFITFGLDDAVFAVDSSAVREIIRLPVVVEVPLSSPNLRGLANVRGSILPIVDLKRLMGRTGPLDADAARVVVIDRTPPFGFVVDRMFRLVGVDPAAIRAIEDADAVCGLVTRQFEGPHGETAIVETLALTGAAGHSGSRDRPPRLPAADEAPRSVEAAQDIQLVAFQLDGQEYALPIDQVREIVKAPGVLHAIPRAAAHALGLMRLRDRLLPVVSLRALFGMPPAALSEQSRIVVLSHRVDGAERVVGLATDAAREILRVPPASIDALPATLSADRNLREVDRTCRLEQGSRLIAILAQDRLLGLIACPGAIGEAFAASEENPMNAEGGAAASDDALHVVFRVADEEYAIPIAAVQEIVRYPDSLTWAPNCPSFVEGLLNLRGTVLPVIDQRRRFGLPERARDDRQRILVSEIDGVRAGFVVDSVSEILGIAAAEIIPAPDLAANEDSAVSHVANLVKSKRVILVLDAARLLSRQEMGMLRAA